MNELEKMNVGFVIRASSKEWQLIEDFVSRHSDIIYVRKTAPAIRLRIRLESGEDVKEGKNNVNVKC